MIPLCVFCMHNNKGNYRSAAACYEKIIKDGPDDIMHHVVSIGSCLQMMEGAYKFVKAR